MKAIIFGMVLGIGSMSCAQHPAAPNVSTPVITVDGPVSVQMKPGMVKALRFKMLSEQVGAELFCKDERLPWSNDNGNAIFFLRESYFSDRAPYHCELRKGNSRWDIASVRVEERIFPVDHLTVKGKYVNPSKKEIAQIERDQKRLKLVYADTPSQLLFTMPFQLPVDTAQTAIYGTKRVFNRVRHSQHLGIDFRAKLGDNVKVAGQGKVVLAGFLFFSGNTVIVSHGLGVYTVYAHMSRLLVKEGDLVERGHVLGLAGSTGRANGPHLHWGVKVHHQWVDGRDLIAATEALFSP